MVYDAWLEVPRRFPTVSLDDFVVMPNHFHALIVLSSPAWSNLNGHPALGDVLGWFKAVTTTRYIRGVRDHGWVPFDGHLWQRSFHDHIVRNDADLDRIRTYIANTPARWKEDTFFEIEHLRTS